MSQRGKVTASLDLAEVDLVMQRQQGCGFIHQMDMQFSHKPLLISKHLEIKEKCVFKPFLLMLHTR